MTSKSSNPFAVEINRIADECGCSHLDAVMEYCERNNIPADSVAPLIRQLPKLKAKIRKDAEALLLVKAKKE
jgi:hypothetical protein